MSDELERMRVSAFVLDLGREMFRAGFETRAVELSVTACAKALGLREVELDITSRSLHVRTGDDPPVLVFVVARDIGSYDLHRMKVLNDVVAEVLEGGISVEEAERCLATASASAGPWPWWLTVAGGGVLAASITLQTKGNVLAALLAAAVLMLVNGVGRLLARTGLPDFYIRLVQGGLAAVAGVVLVQTGVLPSTTAPSLVAANLLLLLPIPAVVALTEDAITGFSGNAAARAVSVGMAVAGVLGGVGIAGALLRDDLPHSAGISVLALVPVLGVAAGVVGSVANAFFMNGHVRLIAPAAVAGLIAATVNLTCRGPLGLPGMLSIGIASTALGAAGVAAGRLLDISPAEFVLTGVTGALLPGLDVYQGLVQAATSAPGAGASMFAALASTATIGAGIVLGVFAAGRRQSTSVHRRLRARS